MRFIHMLLLAAVLSPALPARADAPGASLSLEARGVAGIRKINDSILLESEALRAPEGGCVPCSGHPDRRDPHLALMLSLFGPFATGATAIAFAAIDLPPLRTAGLWVFAASFVLSPSLGHVYVGDWSRVAWMIGARLAVAGAFLAAEPHVRWFSGGDEVPEAIATGSALALLALIAWDVVDAPFAAVRHNRALETSRIAVAPWVGGRSAGGGGLALVVSLP